nr:protein FAR1-RELATED SEQUENCE 5-like [Ipomoea batatas]
MEDEERLNEPKVDMVFQSKEEVFTFYTNYAKKKGFGVVMRSSKHGDDGNLKYFTFACAKAHNKESTSKNLLSSKLSTKTRCQAKIRFKRCEDESFKITTVELSHDHDLSPGKARHLRCHKKLNEQVKRRLDINDQAVVEDVKVGDKRRDVKFMVAFNEVEYEAKCNCRLFEFRGILCRHALLVLILRKSSISYNDIDCVPIPSSPHKVDEMGTQESFVTSPMMPLQGFTWFVPQRNVISTSLDGGHYIPYSYPSNNQLNSDIQLQAQVHFNQVWRGVYGTENIELNQNMSQEVCG